MIQRNGVWQAALVALGMLGGGTQLAQAADEGAQLHPWQMAVKPGAAEAYFTNLKDGDEIQMPFVAHFGLSQGWGLAPVASPGGAKSGHHHLLIDRDLPLDFKQPLPFNKQYIHFGNGQMEAKLDLVPGEYTLRMLLADDKHLPRFVYSKPLKIKVSQTRAPKDAAVVMKPSIALLVGEKSQTSPFKVLFHASGLNVGQKAQKVAGTGHFKLSVLPLAGGPAGEFDFVDGETEVWLQPPPGDYKLTLAFPDNANSDKRLAEVVSTTISVK